MARMRGRLQLERFHAEVTTLDTRASSAVGQARLDHRFAKWFQQQILQQRQRKPKVTPQINEAVTRYRW